MLDDISADARVGSWMARSRADDNLSGLLLDDFLESDLIVAVHADSGAFKDEILVDVPAKGIIVVDKDDV